MELRFTQADEMFRAEVADWLQANLCGEFEKIRFRGGPGDEHYFVEERKAWERRLAEGGWTCIGWPETWGGRGASIEQQVIFNEEYARAGGPGRVGHIGETLTGPTLLAFGTEARSRATYREYEQDKNFGAKDTQNPARALIYQQFVPELSLTNHPDAGASTGRKCGHH